MPKQRSIFKSCLRPVWMGAEQTRVLVVGSYPSIARLFYKIDRNVWEMGEFLEKEGLVQETEKHLCFSWGLCNLLQNFWINTLLLFHISCLWSDWIYFIDLNFSCFKWPDDAVIYLQFINVFIHNLDFSLLLIYALSKL